MEPEPGEYGEWVSAVWGGRGYPGESLIGTRVGGSYAAHAWAVAALSSLAFGPTAFRFLRFRRLVRSARRSDASISMRMSFECVKCCFGTGARTLLLLAMSISVITASGSSSPPSVHGPAASRAVAVLMRVYGQDYIESKELVWNTHRDSEPGLALAGTGMSRSPGCRCVV